MTSQERIDAALAIAAESGGTDGGHHKMWVIDQMVRALTGCPLVQAEALDAYGKPYAYESYGMSNEYKYWLADYADGEDGPHTYSWDIGVAP